jgi:hypothetical protein
VQNPFNLCSDLGERHNLVTDHAEKAQELFDSLEKVRDNMDYSFLA